MAKKSNGEGSIGKYIKNGVQIGWRASIMTDERKENGKPIRKEFYGKTQKEVKLKLDEYKKNKLLGLSSTNDNVIFQEWFKTWLFDIKSNSLKNSTLVGYDSHYRNYIKDSPLGKMKLKDIKLDVIQNYYSYLRDERNVSLGVIKKIHRCIKDCLNVAVTQDLVLKNYSLTAQLPTDDSIKKDKENYFTLKEQEEFVNGIHGHSNETFFLTALYTGLRVAELIGLKWEDIDFEKKKLTVKRTVKRDYKLDKNGNRESAILVGTPKTKNSYRDVPIPDILIPKLKKHKVAQAEHILSIGDAYINNNYVFTTANGLPFYDATIRHSLYHVLKKLNIRKITIHGFRHTYATRLFENGVPAKTVQTLLGHADIKTSLNIYTHVNDDFKVDAVNKLNNLFNL